MLNQTKISYNFSSKILCHFRYLCRSYKSPKTEDRTMSSSPSKTSANVQELVKLEKEVAEINVIKQGLYYGSLKYQ